MISIQWINGKQLQEGMASAIHTIAIHDCYADKIQEHLEFEALKLFTNDLKLHQIHFTVVRYSHVTKQPHSIRVYVYQNATTITAKLVDVCPPLL